jgi:hypothetical protein
MTKRSQKKKNQKKKKKKTGTKRWDPNSRPAHPGLANGHTLSQIIVLIGGPVKL